MNRRKLFAVLCLLSLCLPMVASAEWVQKEIKWNISGVTGTGDGIYVRDTSKVILGGGTTTLDTTGTFTLKFAVPPRGAPPIAGTVNGTTAGATNADSCAIAYLVFQADSTAAPTATLSTMTLIVDGRSGGFGPTVTMGRGWVKCDSIVVNAAAGNAALETIIAPIANISRITGQNTNISVQAFEQLRARVLSATGVLSSARAFVRYWRPTVAGTGE